MNAAVILTECVLEASHNKQDLWVTTLDTQKAFDVVDRGSLLRRLYLDGIEGDDWLLVRDMYSDCSSRIKWAGGISHPINITQGVRQGGGVIHGPLQEIRQPNPVTPRAEIHRSKNRINWHPTLLLQMMLPCSLGSGLKCK